MQILRAFASGLGRRREAAEGARVQRAGGRKRKVARSPGGRAAAAVGDVTARTALEFLAADDAEGALVFALVHDPEFRLATALTSSPEGATDARVVRALLVVFEDYEDQLRKFLGLLMYREMAATYNWNELFRANSAATALLREYTCDLGADFLSSALADVVADLFEEDDVDNVTTASPCLYEVNPRYLRPTDDLPGNQRRLEALAERILDRLLSAAPLFPYQVAKIYRVLEIEMRRLLERDARLNRASSSGLNLDPTLSLLPRLSSFSRMDRAATSADPTAGSTVTPPSSFEEDARISVGNGSSRSLPRLSSIDEDLTDATITGVHPTGSSRGSNPSLLRSSSSSAAISTARDEFLLHLGGLLFLRFICPALVAPQSMALTPNGAPPSKRVHRALVLAAKLLQSLANGVESARGELYMAPFAAFLARNRPRLARLYDAVCQQFENDQRRESAISRSNQAPRLSQLWAHAGSSGSSRCSTCSFASSAGRNTAIASANSSAAGAVNSREGALVMLRRWMRAHVELLASEVADNDKFQWQKKSIVVEASDPDATLSDEAKRKTHKKKRHKPPARKLKTNVMRESAVIPTDKIAEEMDAVDAADHDEEEDEDDGSSDESDDEALAPDGGVSPAEFDALVGQATHRDIQLMRIYYARVVSRGLERLLRVNDAAHSREWALHKKTSAGVPDGFEVQVYRRSRAFADRSNKLVEMKAVVRVRRAPREVFSYLKSLESSAPSLHDGGDGACSLNQQLVREVEPLDEGKAVLYRSCGKLSPWPAWLVKPRDSCDLHGFVERTGRADTFAVLLESVPRPDVPEVRGVVRMAFASGGLLVEPGEASDEMKRMAGKHLGKGAAAAITASATAETTASATIPAASEVEATTQLTCVVRADFKGAMPRYLAESICFRQVMRVDAIRAHVEAQRDGDEGAEAQGGGQRTKKRRAAAAEWV